MTPFPPQGGRPPMPQPQGQAAPGAAPQPPQQGAPVPPGAGGEEIRGAQRVSNTEFNQQMQNILLSRIEEEGQKNPNFGQAIASGVSPQAAMELALVLPELIPLMRMAGLLQGEGGGAGPIGQPSAPAGAPGGLPQPGQGGMPPQPPQGPAGYDDEDDEEESAYRPGISRGLMG